MRKRIGIFNDTEPIYDIYLSEINSLQSICSIFVLGKIINLDIEKIPGRIYTKVSHNFPYMFESGVGFFFFFFFFLAFLNFLVFLVMKI